MRRRSWLYLSVAAVWVALMVVWLVPIGRQDPSIVAPLLVSTLALIWALALYPFKGHRTDWAVYPIFVAFFVVLILHVLLVVRGPFRPAMVLYAGTHLVLWVPFGFLCVFLITREGP